MFRTFFVCFMLTEVSVGTGIYRVSRQDFDVNSRKENSMLSSYQQGVGTGRNGVFKVSRQDFVNNNDETPFSENVGKDIRFLYPRRHPFYLKRNDEYEYGSSETTSMPKLFVPTYPQTVPNYNNVLSMSQFGDSNSGNNGELAPGNVKSPIVQSAPPASDITSYFTTSTESPFAPDDDDGILPAIGHRWEGEKPLRPITNYSKLNHPQIVSRTDGDEKGTEYHSVNDLVEISDDRKELLLEILQKSANRRLDSIPTLNVASAVPIRRRRRFSQNYGFYPYDVSPVYADNTMFPENNAGYLQILTSSSGQDFPKQLSLPMLMPVPVSVAMPVALLFPAAVQMPVSVPMPFPYDPVIIDVEQETIPNAIQISLDEQKPSALFNDGYEQNYLKSDAKVSCTCLENSTNNSFVNEQTPESNRQNFQELLAIKNDTFSVNDTVTSMRIMKNVSEVEESNHLPSSEDSANNITSFNSLNNSQLN